MIKKHCFFGFFFFLSFSIYAQSEKQDSTQLVAFFNEAIQNVEDRKSLISQIEQIFEKNKNNNLIVDTYYYNYSKYYFYLAELDSALFFAEEGIQLYSKSPFQIKKSKFHNLRGSIFSLQKLYPEAIKEFQKSIEILETNKDVVGAAYIKNNIANLFFSLRDYESAYQYSFSSYNDLKENNDSINLPSITGILAISEIKLGKIEEGEKHTEECLSLSKKYKNSIGLIVGYYAEGELFLIRGKDENAKNSFLKSLELSSQFGQKHYELLNKINLLQVSVKLNDFSNAIIYGEEALSESIDRQNENTLYSIYKNLGYAYYGNGNYIKAYDNLNQAHELLIQISDEKNKEIINEILVKYETEKKEKTIIENELKISKNEKDINQRNAFIFLLSTILITLIFIYFLYNRFQKQKQFKLIKEQEAKIFIASIEGEEKERERISNDIHDGLASKITGIKIQVENLSHNVPISELEKISTELSLLHEETRRVSHNLMPLQLDLLSLPDAIHQYCMENSSENLKLDFQRYESEKPVLNPIVSKVLYRIVQELIHNVQKHSQSKICYVQFTFQNKLLQISVEDEGIGFDVKNNKNNQGIESIKKRIKDIGGELIIESEIGKGTLSLIEIKLH